MHYCKLCFHLSLHLGQSFLLSIHVLGSSPILLHASFLYTTPPIQDSIQGILPPFDSTSQHSVTSGAAKCPYAGFEKQTPSHVPWGQACTHNCCRAAASSSLVEEQEFHRSGCGQPEPVITQQALAPLWSRLG